MHHIGWYHTEIGNVFDEVRVLKQYMLDINRKYSNSEIIFPETVILLLISGESRSGIIRMESPAADPVTYKSLIITYKSPDDVCVPTTVYDINDSKLLSRPQYIECHAIVYTSHKMKMLWQHSHYILKF